MSPWYQGYYYSPFDTNVGTLQQNSLATIDLLNSRTFPGMPPHKLKLKEGMICFVEQNLSVDDGLTHSQHSKVEVVALRENGVEVRLLSGPHEEQI